jgi:hypothetical protein
LAASNGSSFPRPTLASRKASLLGLDNVNAESDRVADPPRLQQKESESSRISERLAAIRAWFASLRERRSDSGKVQPLLAQHGLEETSPESRLMILGNISNAWNWWLVADFYRVQLPVVGASIVLLILSGWFGRSYPSSDFSSVLRPEQPRPAANSPRPISGKSISLKEIDLVRTSPTPLPLVAEVTREGLSQRIFAALQVIRSISSSTRLS